MWGEAGNTEQVYPRIHLPATGRGKKLISALKVRRVKRESGGAKYETERNENKRIL